MEHERVSFDAALWIWRKDNSVSQDSAMETLKGNWFFVSLPCETAEWIRFFAEGRITHGWGSIPVRAQIAKTVWSTSIFPYKRDNTYILPIKAAVRQAEGLRVGQSYGVSLEVR